MTLMRFAVLALSAVGIAACAYASARLVGWVPAGKLPPYPAWAAIHMASAAAFAVVAPLQLWPRLRTRRPHVLPTSLNQDHFPAQRIDRHRRQDAVRQCVVRKVSSRRGADARASDVARGRKRERGREPDRNA